MTFSIYIELIRLFASVASLRPVLESLLYRILKYSTPEYRLDALKGVGQLIQKPDRLLDISGPLYDDENNQPFSDLSLLLL